MVADASIYSLIRPPQPSNPLEDYGKALTIQSLIGQQQTQGLQRQQLQQSIDDDTATRNFWANLAPGEDPRTKISDLIRVNPKAGIALQKSYGEQDKSAAELAKTRQETLKSALATHRDALSGVTTPEQAAQWVAAAYQDPVLGPFSQRVAGPLEGALSRIPTDPAGLADWTKRNGLGLEKFLANQVAQEGNDIKAGQAKVTAANQPFNADGTPNAAYQEYRQRTARAGATNVNVSNGPLTPGKSAQTKIDEGLLDTTSRLQRLNAIEQGFKPEFQQFAPRLSNTWSSIKEKSGVGLTATDQRNLSEFSSFKRNAVDNLSQYIKEITGAAMGVQEAERITRGMPNPGTGVFDGDSPTEFKAKMSDVIRQTRMAEARLVYLKRNGFSLSDANGNPTIPLDRMPALMNQRGSELETQLKSQNPSAKPADVQKAVRRQLAQEFGLVYE